MMELPGDTLDVLELAEGERVGFAVVGRGATTVELLRLVEGRQARALVTWNVGPGESVIGYLADLEPGLYATRVVGDGCAVLGERELVGPRVDTAQLRLL